MKRTLLLAALAATVGVAAVNAQKVHDPQLSTRAIEPAQAITVRQTGSVVDVKKLPAGRLMQTVRDANGCVYKRLVGVDSANAPIESMAHKLKAAKARIEAQTIDEDFEAYDGSDAWQPEGWSTESLGESLEPWWVGDPSAFWTAGHHGSYAELVSLAIDAPIDEWLVTPFTAVESGMSLRALVFYDLLFALNFDYLDFDTFEFTEYHPSQALKIWAREEGGEWQLVYDLYQDAVGLSYMELLDLYTGNFEEKTFDISAFEGKTVQFGFQNVGFDGNTAGLDMVAIGMPALTPSYMFPDGTFWFGIDREFMGMSASIPVLPVYADLTWRNTSQMPEGVHPDYAWMYMNADSDYDVSFDRDLTTSYRTDYSSEFTTRNNLYYPPTLMAMAEGWSEGSYDVFTYFQVGGNAEYDTSAGMRTFGMMPFDPASEGYTHATASYQGESIPAFGYSPLTDDFWTEMVLGTDDPADRAHLDAVYDVFPAPTHPLVVSGIWAHACVKELDPQAVLTLEVLAEDNSGFGNLLASATLTADQARYTLGESYMLFDFRFDQPLVLSGMPDQLLKVRLSGLHGAASFIAPMQSYYGHYSGENRGYAEIGYTLQGETGTVGLPIDQLTGTPQAFGFAFDACYPWLVTGAGYPDDFTFEDDHQYLLIGSQELAIPLDSYYDGSELTVESEHVTASVTGRYDKAVLTIVPLSDVNTWEYDTVTISAPGVKLAFNLKNELSGIEAVGIDAASHGNIFDLQGRPVTNPAPGLYIRHNPNGPSSKVIIR